MEPKRYNFESVDYGRGAVEVPSDDGEYVRYEDPAIVLALRKAKAFDAIASRTVGIVSEAIRNVDGRVWSPSLRQLYKWPSETDLLTAIEEAIKCDTQP